jgi:Flp pilus assembly protein TadD
MESGQYRKAVGRFEKLVELEPKNIQYRFYHGVSLAESGDADHALEELAYVKANAKDQNTLNAVEQYMNRLQ